MTTLSRLRTPLALLTASALAVLGLGSALAAPRPPEETPQPEETAETTQPDGPETPDAPDPGAGTEAGPSAPPPAPPDQGPEPAMELQKLTNGVAQDTAPGGLVAVGSVVEWTYEVTNTGSTNLRIDSLVDDWTSDAGTGSIDVDVAPPAPLDAILLDAADDDAADAAAGPVEPADAAGAAAPVPEPLPADANAWVAPGESVVLEAQAPATLGQYSNVATVTATPVAADGTELGAAITATDASFYLGGDAGIQVSSQVQGYAATTAPGPGAALGATVTWTHTVTNTGTIGLTGVTLTQDQATTAQSAAVTGLTWDAIAPGASVTGQTTAAALHGQAFSDTLVTADSALGPVSAGDKTWYYGGTPAFDVVVAINGHTAGAAPGESLAADAEAEATVTVRNTGQTYLDRITAQIAVSTNGAPAVQRDTEGPAGPLEPGKTRTFTIKHKPPAGESELIATVAAVAVTQHGDRLQQQPPAATATTWFTAGEAGLGIVTTLNGAEHPSAPGLTTSVGSELRWSFTVTNTGALPLTNVTVTGQPEVTDTVADEPAPASTNAIPIGSIESLAPQESVVLNAVTQAQEGHIRATATATAANPEGGANVSASDTTYYTGGPAELALVKEVAAADGEFRPEAQADIDAPVTWRVTVTNWSEATLTDVVVDDPLANQGLQAATLAPGESTSAEWTLSPADLVAPEELEPGLLDVEVRNTATATALRPDGTELRAAASALVLATVPVVEEEEEEVELPTTETKGRTISPLGWAGIAAAVAAAIGAGVYFARREHKPPTS